MVSVPARSRLLFRFLIRFRWLLVFGVLLAVAWTVYAFNRPKEDAPATTDDATPVAANASPATGTQEGQADDDDHVRAPELDGGVGWLNTAGPVRLKDLRGKVVLLDFWTFCCINCIHTLPDLAKLEKKYANQLDVIGVHSAKFDNEKKSESIRKAILRYEIHHPVVNDANMKIWRAYRVQSWPTLYLIDPDGRLIGRGSGEGLYEALDEAIGKLVKDYRDKKKLNERPIKFELARSHEKGD